MLTTIGGGFCTRRPSTEEAAVTFSFTAAPGFAWVASAVAVRVFGANAIRSALPVTVTVVLLGGLVTTMFDPGLKPYVKATEKVFVVGGFCAKATAPSMRIASPRASS